MLLAQAFDTRGLTQSRSHLHLDSSYLLFSHFTQGGDKAMSHSAHRPLCSLRQLSWHAQRWTHHCGVGGIHTLK